MDASPSFLHMDTWPHSHLYQSKYRIPGCEEGLIRGDEEEDHQARVETAGSIPQPQHLRGQGAAH